jgi:RNA polymerase sigma factor (sigma-70 family)
MDVKLPPFQALLDEFATDVYRFCVATAGPNEADDAFQETWIAAMRAYPKLRRDDNLRAWLLQIAQNKAIDQHRSRRRRPVPVEGVPDEGRTDSPARLEGELWDAVRELPPKQRTAVFCRSVLGMSYAELAAVLDSTEEAARRNVFEGLKRLREDWAQ